MPPATGEGEPTQLPIEIWIHPAVPSNLLNPVMDLLTLEGGEFFLVDNPLDARVQVVPDADQILARWVYAAVVPFPTLEDALSFHAIREIWAGSVADSMVFASGDTASALSSLLGPPDVDSLIFMDRQELLEGAWAERPTLALVPFEALEPRWKVLEVDGQVLKMI